MMKLFIMCGIPNAGKSTKSNAMSDEMGATIIRLDDYRKMLHRHTYQEMVEDALEDVKTALSQGKDVIYDSANIYKTDRAQVINAVVEYAPEIICVYMATPAEVCVARDDCGWSSFAVPRFETPTEDEGFELIVCNDGIPND